MRDRGAMMTTRERLNRRKRLTGIGLLGGLVVTVAGIAAAVAFDGAPGVAMVVPGLVLLVGAAAASQGFPVRCPGCGGNLSQLLMRGGGWRVDPKVRFCPYCAASIDADPTADPAAAAEDEVDAAGW